MTTLTRRVYEQIALTYETMAFRVRYRPAAPSDGFGNITVPEEELNLATEVDLYSRRWWEEEDSGDYHIGCPDMAGRPALIYVVEAARSIAAVDYPLAQRLLEEATEELAVLAASNAQ